MGLLCLYRFFVLEIDLIISISIFLFYIKYFFKKGVACELALFKVFKGSNTAKITDPEATGYITPNANTDGYAYYDTSTKLFYIDANYPGTEGITRQPINAKKADIATLALAAEKDGTGEHTIVSYYGHSLGLNNSVLTLKDGNNTNLSSVTFGALASADAVTGTYTPSGTNTASEIRITPITTNVSKVTNSGTIPTLTTSVTDEKLIFNFSSGAMPTFDSVTVWNGYSQGISNSYAMAQTFSGTQGTITLSPVTGGAQNGDNVHF